MRVRVTLYADLLKIAEKIRNREGDGFLRTALEHFSEYSKKRELRGLLDEMMLFNWYIEYQRKEVLKLVLTKEEERKIREITKEVLEKLRRPNVYVSEDFLIKFSIYCYAKDKYNYESIEERVKKIYKRLEKAYIDAVSKFINKKYRRSLEEDIKRIEKESRLNTGAYIAFLYNQKEIRETLKEVLHREISSLKFFTKILELLRLLGYFQVTRRFEFMPIQKYYEDAKRAGLIKKDKLTDKGKDFIMRFLGAED